MSVGGPAWHIDCTTDKHVDVLGFTKKHQISDVQIGGGTTAHDLPDGRTILLKANEATMLNDESASLASAMQMQENQFSVDQTSKKIDGFPHIEVDGTTIPPQLSKGLLTIPIRTPTAHELQTCETINLASEDPWDPNQINDAEISADLHNDFCKNKQTRHACAK